MDGRTIYMWVEFAITFAGGAYCTLLGYRLIGKKQGEDEKWDKWHTKFDKFMKIAGPLLMVWAFVHLCMNLSKTP